MSGHHLPEKSPYEAFKSSLNKKLLPIIHDGSITKEKWLEAIKAAQAKVRGEYKNAYYEFMFDNRTELKKQSGLDLTSTGSMPTSIADQEAQ